jgi:integrase
MPSTRLTQAVVDKVRPPAEGRITYWDKILPGFGLRISAKGRRTWLAMYRVRGKLVAETFGTTALIPSLSDARERARESLLAAKRGVNPVAERRAQAAKAEGATKTTLEAVFALYVQRQLRPKTSTRTAKAVVQYFAKDVLPRLGKRDISDISSKDIERLLDGVIARGAPVAANRLLSRLRTFFRWCVKRGEIERDPTAMLDKPEKETARDRILSDDEIVLFWRAADKVDWPYGPLAQLLLLTAQRRNEVAEIEWTEFDLDKQLWVIPKERSKNGMAHEVHLSPLACEILAKLPRINSSRYVFTTTGAKPVSVWTGAKASLDKHIGEIPHWTLHDLRRTAASRMARFAPPHVVDKILNHSGKISGVAAVYNRYQYSDERQIALNNWSRYLENLLNPEPTNVIPLAATHHSASGMPA